MREGCVRSDGRLMRGTPAAAASITSSQHAGVHGTGAQPQNPRAPTPTTHHLDALLHLRVIKLAADHTLRSVERVGGVRHRLDSEEGGVSERVSEAHQRRPPGTPPPRDALGASPPAQQAAGRPRGTPQWKASCARPLSSQARGRSCPAGGGRSRRELERAGPTQFPPPSAYRNPISKLPHLHDGHA